MADGKYRFLLLLFVNLMIELSCAGAIDGRTLCGPGDVSPLTRVNTTDRLISFRRVLSQLQMDTRPLAAFIIGSADAHNSEYPTEYDKRLKFISGFGGSAGTVVITTTKAALWTDGRYFLEADSTLDCNWSLMKSGLPETPTMAKWLSSELKPEGGLVGVDKTLISKESFQSLNESLRHPVVLTLVDGIRNPVDAIWTEGRPQRPVGPINALPLNFAGVSWQDKVKNIRVGITAAGAGAFVVTALDEIAWLFNLRGLDIDYNPFFLSYSIIELNRIRLYILNKETRLVADPTDAEARVKLHTHLETNEIGNCSGRPDPCVEVLNYVQADVEKDLMELASRVTVLVTPQTNYGVVMAVQNNSTTQLSLIANEKSVKNPTERAGMQNSHNRDSAALIQFLAFMEKEIKSGKNWTEVSASEELKKRRLSLPYNRGLSFETIAGYGSHGAIVHYRPSPDTDRIISTDSLFLLDSGGQYLDGTTDVTRTLHYGTPTQYEKECYTRVLMAAINLALTKWPLGLLGRQLDIIAREQLWQAGLEYRHGTGHGIGAYLSVHEGPGRISYLSQYKYEQPLEAFQYYSDEPGYYEDGHFGIRLETIVTIKPFTPKYNRTDKGLLQFAPVTLVPFEPNLMNFSLMSKRQINWLNEYNAQINENILPLLNDQAAIDWMNARTKPIPIHGCISSADWLVYSYIVTPLAIAVSLYNLAHVE